MALLVRLFQVDDGEPHIVLQGVELLVASNCLTCQELAPPQMSSVVHERSAGPGDATPIPPSRDTWAYTRRHNVW